MIRRPPWGIASTALTTRFTSTCSIWCGSTFTCPRSASSQPATRLHLLRLEELDLELGLRLVRLQALGDVPERDQRPGDPVSLPERRRDVVDGHRGAVPAKEHLGLQIAGMAVRARAVD